MKFLTKINFFLVFPVLSLVFLLGVPNFQTVHAQNDQIQPTFVFLRDLRFGDSGEDVRELQKLLNRDPETQVSVDGNGSPGLESTFFGPATQTAVMRFQEKYKNEVLSPAGLTQSSGFVGLWTKLKLNQLLLGISVTQTPAEPAQSSIPSIPSIQFVSEPNPLTNTDFSSLFGKTDKLTVYGASTNVAKPGDLIVLSGANFDILGRNTVNLGPKIKISNIPAGNPSTLRFVVPINTVPGRYDLFVTKNKEKTDPIPFMVTTPGASAPVIEKIEPETVKYGQKITITGQNFTPTGNIFTSGLGVVKDLKSSDGKTIILTIEKPEGFEIKEADEPLFWMVRPYIVNTNGMSVVSEVAKFSLEI